MKYKLLFLLLIPFGVARAVDITGFGSGDFTATVPFGADSQNAATYSISGTDTSSLYGTFAPVSSLGSVVTLYLQGILTFATNPATNFQVRLYDSDGDGRIYQTNWSAFISSGVETEVALSFVGLDNSGTGGFSGTAVAFALVGAGSGTATINFQLDNLATTSAIPEPCTYAALFGAAALGLAVWRKRRKAV